jgi:predicted DsbA family dithiol-disulfide isomerase
MKIDFVSDVACPWCAVGLHSLEMALQRLGPDAAVTLHCQPFELNPGMAAEGADAGEYLKAKYGMGDEQLAANRAHLRERGDGRNPGDHDVLLELAAACGLDAQAA